MNKKILSILVILIIVFVSIVLISLIEENDNGQIQIPSDEDLSDPDEIKDVKRFVSEKEFEDYLAQAIELQDPYYRSSFGQADFLELSEPLMAVDSIVEKSAERYSETNVQVMGIDEPDIVKTDGKNIYASLQDNYYWGRQQDNKTKIIQAFPLEKLFLTKEIDDSGKLLLKDNILVIFSNDRVLGYNISNSKEPKLEWEIKIDNNSQVTNARLYQNKIYLVINNRVVRDQPCIIKPLIINEKSLEIPCTDIYYPGRIIPINTIYTLLTIDILTGEKQNNISFVGSINNSVIYMSTNNFYLSNYEPVNLSDFIISFLTKECIDLIPQNILERLEKLTEYDISSRAKEVELEIILGEFFNSLSANEGMKLENEITNRLPEFYKENRYDLESTGIVKIDLNSFKILASESVPGRLLNQFALDEYNNNLRVAVTIGENFWWTLGSMPGIESINDVYILDKNLKEIGAVKGLGEGERIYAVRFLQDKGYVVTFREIDPFYILDLSNPNKPEMKGELKIPGYSSYLHPIKENIILGIGKEGRNVKISLFDVKNPYNPQEIEKYFLNDYWTEILNNHHAFLLDAKHEIFFLPGGQGGYIFSFQNNKLKLVKTIKQAQVKRALYIDDYLYIISIDNIIVLDQNNWEIVKDIKI